MRQLGELEVILQQLVTEHEKLLRQLDDQQTAMKRMDLRGMEDACKAQEGTRLRITSMETRRRAMVTQVALALKISAPATLAKVAEAAGAQGPKLMALRGRLRELVGQVSNRSHVASRLASAVLGHLNTMVRLVAGAVEQPGVYTKHGTPQVAGRIGVLEAIG